MRTVPTAGESRATPVWKQIGIVFLALTCARGAGASEPGPAPAGSDFFETKVRPVLAEHCYACHSAQAKKLKGGLLLDTLEGMRKGGETGPAVVPGSPTRAS